MVAIIDYDAGNVRSVEKAIQTLGETTILTRNPELILNADHVILPGVGSFSDAMDKLEKYNLISVIQNIIECNIPFLGICLGMQLLFESSDEAPGRKGLGILPGKILKIPALPERKVPHMGWNSLYLPHKTCLFSNIEQEAYVYFVHSYYLRADQEDIVAATTEYGVTIHAAVEKDHVYACQFHPEKSSEVGLRILRNFLNVKKEML